MSSIDVLFVIDGLWVGGTERSVAELVTHLPQLGVSCGVACLRRRDQGVEGEVRSAGVEVYDLPGAGLFGQAAALRRLCGRVRPRVVHSALFRADLVARLGCFRSTAILVNSLVNTPYDAARLSDLTLNRRKIRLAQAVDVVTGRLLVDHFHAVSEAAKAAAVRDQRIAPERISVVRRGRDPRRLGDPSRERRQRARAALGLQPDALVLVNVARQDVQKGQQDLLEAFSILADDVPEAVLLLVGREGSASPSLRATLSGLVHAPRVRLLGHRDDVPDILAASDVFVFPSLWEGYPGAVLEAMALALPVVASDIAPTREIVAPDVGVLVPARSPQRLAGALRDVLADASRRRAMGLAGRRVFLALHTLHASAQAMRELYSRLLSDRG